MGIKPAARPNSLRHIPQHVSAENVRNAQQKLLCAAVRPDNSVGSVSLCATPLDAPPGRPAAWTKWFLARPVFLGKELF